MPFSYQRTRVPMAARNPLPFYHAATMREQDVSERMGELSYLPYLSEAL